MLPFASNIGDEPLSLLSSSRKSGFSFMLRNPFGCSLHRFTPTTGSLQSVQNSLLVSFITLPSCNLLLQYTQWRRFVKLFAHPLPDSSEIHGIDFSLFVSTHTGQYPQPSTVFPDPCRAQESKRCRYWLSKRCRHGQLGTIPLNP